MSWLSRAIRVVNQGHTEGLGSLREPHPAVRCPRMEPLSQEPLTPEQRQTLEDLYRRIDERVSSITSTHAWWPCRRGCDHCCRHLAAPLTVTRLEWTYLWEGFQALPPQARAEIRARVEPGNARPMAGRPAGARARHEHELSGVEGCQGAR